MNRRRTEVAPRNVCIPSLETGTGCFAFATRPIEAVCFVRNGNRRAVLLSRILIASSMLFYCVLPSFAGFLTANGYSAGTSEEYLGRALKKNVARDKVVIASKVYFNPGRLSRAAIMREIDGTLRRLGTDYLDLYIIHRFDYDTPIEETMEALHDLVKAGKVRALGASAMYGYQFYNMQIVARVHELAERKGCKMSQIALAWQWAKGVASPIVGATKARYLDDAAGALEVHLTPEEVAWLEECYLPHPIVGAVAANPPEGVVLLDEKK